MPPIDPVLLATCIQLTIAAILGLLLGTERSIAGKTAGMRTFALVSLGACLFVVVSTIVTTDFLGRVNFDPMRVPAAIITGVGFIGGGLIIFKREFLRGLTTAAGLWVAAGVGAAVGFKLYSIAIFVTLLTLLIFTAVWFVEQKIKDSLGAQAGKKENEEDHDSSENHSFRHITEHLEARAKQDEDDLQRT